MCEHHAPQYLRGWSPALGSKPGDPALESRVTREGYTPPPVGQVAGEGGKGGAQGLLSGPSPNRAMPSR